MGEILAALSGFAVGVLSTALLLRRRRQHGWTTFGTRGRGAVVPLVRSPHQPPPDEIERMLRVTRLVTTLERSPLRHAIGVGGAATVGDVTVELIAIEVREVGCRGSLRFRSSIEPIERMGPHALPGEPEVTVADDLGTVYETGAGMWSGGPAEGQAEFLFAPRPPEGARRLTVSILRFAERTFPPGMPSVPTHPTITGPWVFEIALEA